MSSAAYELVYDASSASREWIFALPGAVFLCVFGVLAVRKHRSPTRDSVGLPYTAVMLFAALWCVAAVYGIIVPAERLRSALRSGTYVMVEGVVMHFVPGDAEDHVEEEWDVESGGEVHHYHYVRSRLTPGFRRVGAHGGPIREGLRVRIADVDGYIARLEIAQ